jgi:hypothetical protein
MCAAEEVTIVLNAVTDDAAIAMLASWSHSMYSAFKRIERTGAAGHRDGERFVVGISADIACGHVKAP